MGVVRREGDWRLEKQQEGVYEITHKKNVERKVVTSDYRSQGFDDQRMDFAVPVDEVESYADVERVFERMQSKQDPGTGLGNFGSGSLSSGMQTGDGDGELGDLPPGGVLLVGVIGGGLFVFQSGFDPQSVVFLVGVGLLLLAVAVSAMAYVRYRSGGVGEAAEFLLGDGEEASTAVDEGEDSVEKTPPAPQKLKDELYFERADRKCEWCDERIDAPEVHHIVPRSKGGPNEPDNLAVLCPNCHQKADRGVISRSRLQYRIAE